MSIALAVVVVWDCGPDSDSWSGSEVSPRGDS